MEKMNGTSKNIVQENVERLKELFPEVFTEGKIDFETLQEVLGEFVDDRDERYSFNWNGKSKARMISQTPSTGTLRPNPDESVDWDNTKNIYIEGDNLEVLKLLQKSYHKKVKMIYIDPPYNTGKDFVYKDNFKDNIKNYKEITGQVDSEGRNLSSNPETSGRYHTDWLNMMYPRLKLARNLLRDDGVIFISIDDNEVANLRKMCDEIFGEENFVGVFPWRSRTAKADVPFGVSIDVEWIICYAKSNTFVAGRSGERNYLKSVDYEDRWRLQDLTKNTTASERPNSFFTMVNPKNGDKYPASETRTWSVTTDTFDDYYKKGKIVFPGDYDFLNIKKPAFRVFEKEDKEKAIRKFGCDEIKMSVSTYLPEKEIGRTENGTIEIRQLFNQQIFPYPKPTTLLKYFVANISDEDALILDFFSGSATTAHAVMQLNAEDGGNRRFILVQLPEKTDESSEAYKAGYKNIAEIGKERIRRAAKKIKEENSEYTGDLGFKVFKLDSTNIKPWETDFDSFKNEYVGEMVENIKSGRTEADILYEILLKYGIDLTLPVTEHTLSGKKVWNIGAGALLVCLADTIPIEVADGIVKLKEELTPKLMSVVFKDSCFEDDVIKTNTLQILKRAGIEDVRSL